MEIWVESTKQSNCNKRKRRQQDHRWVVKTLVSWILTIHNRRWYNLS